MTDEYCKKTGELVTNEKVRGLLQQFVVIERGRSYNTPELSELSDVMVNLIESSDFGSKEATAEYCLQGFTVDDYLDRYFIEGLKVGTNMLGHFGDVSVVPYSRGIGTKTATYQFKPRGEIK